MSRESNILLYYAFIFASLSAFASENGCIPFMTVEQLLRSPEDYNRQIIVVEGWTRSGREFFALQAVKEPFQKELIWLENIDFVRATEKILPGEKKY